MKLAYMIILTTALMGEAFGSHVRKAEEAVDVTSKDERPRPVQPVGELGDEEPNSEAKIGSIKLQHRETGLCASYRSGGWAELEQCYNAPTFSYSNLHLIAENGMCLSVYSNDVWVLVESCNNSARQDWYGVRVHGTSYTYRFMNRHTKKFLGYDDYGQFYGDLEVEYDNPFTYDQQFTGIPLSFFA